MNINGIKNKTSLIKNLLSKLHIHFLGLQETWLRNTDIIDLHIINRVEQIPIHLNNTPRKGMLITTLKNNIHSWESVQTYSLNSLAILTNNILIIFVYFPREKIKEELKLLCKLIDNTDINNILILGDFNIHGYNLDTKNKYKKYSFNLVEEELNIRHITHHTYLNHQVPSFESFMGCNTPDHVFSRGLNLKTYISNEYTNSDHKLIISEISINTQAVQKHILRKSLNIKNILSTKAQKLALQMENTFKNTKDISYNIFVDTIYNAYNIYFKNNLVTNKLLFKRFIKKLTRHNPSPKAIALINTLNKEISHSTNYNNTMETSRLNMEQIKNILYKHQPLWPSEAFKVKRVDIPPITLNEFNLALNDSGFSKSPGEDGITFEVLRLLGLNGRNYLLHLFNQFLSTLKIPQSWSQTITIPTTKNNIKYRPITLLNTTRQLFEKILFYRLNKSFICNPNQGGFRQNKNTFMQNLALEFNIAKYRDAKKRALVFLDIQNAYDSVQRNLLYKKMSTIQNLSPYIPIIKALLESNTTKIYWNFTISDPIHLYVGLNQGSVLSPILYNIFINDLASSVPVQNAKILLYADDVVLITNNANTAQKALNSLQSYADLNMFKFNLEKCAAIMKDTQRLTLYRRKIKVVDHYSYLGIHTDAKGLNIKVQLFKNWQKTLVKWRHLINTGVWDRNSNSNTLVGLVKKHLLPILEYGIFLGCNKSSLIHACDKLRLKLIRAALKLPKFSNTKRTYWLSGIEPFKLKSSKLMVKTLSNAMFDSDATALQEELAGYHTRKKHKKRKQLDELLAVRIERKIGLYYDYCLGLKFLKKIEKSHLNIWLKKYLTNSFVTKGTFQRNTISESQKEIKLLFNSNQLNILFKKHKNYMEDNNYH